MVTLKEQLLSSKSRANSSQNEVEQLQRETLRLSEELGEVAQQLHMEKEASQQLFLDLKAAEKKIAEYEQDQLEVARESTLERYKAVEEERRKWEAREARLLRQLDALQGEAVLTSNTSGLQSNSVPTSLTTSTTTPGSTSTDASSISPAVHLTTGLSVSARPYVPGVSSSSTPTV